MPVASVNAQEKKTLLTSNYHFQDTLKRIGNSLRILRHRHNCQLPVEIFGFPAELAASSSKGAMDDLLDLGGVSFKEVRTKHTVHGDLF